MQKVPDTGRTALLVIELSSGTASLHGQEVELPFREFRLLAELARRVGEPAPSSELIAAVWPDEPWTPKENLYMLVTRLRRLIDGSTKFGKHIRNRRGFGYFLDLDPNDVVVVEHSDAETPEASVIRLDEAESGSQRDARSAPPPIAPEPLEEHPPAEPPERADKAGLRLLIAAAVALGLVAASWSAGYMLSSRTGSTSESRRDLSAGMQDEASPRPTPTTAKPDRKPGDRRAHSSAKRNQRPNKRAGGRPDLGQGAPASAPAVSEGSSASNLQPRTQSQPRSEGSRKGSTKPSPRPEPALPPAPTRYLYHLFNQRTGDHFVTTDSNVASDREAMGYTGGVVGRVYTSQVEGTKAVPTNHGTAYIFVSSSPETEPHSATLSLWYSTNNAGDFFYTTSQAEANQSGWQASVIGYVRTP